MQVCSLHIAGNGDECLMCKEFFILLPSLVLQMTHRKKKFGDEKLHFFHVAHFSAAFIFFHSKRNWWFYCLKCIALRTQRVMRRIFQGFFWWQFLSHTCCNCFLTSKILIASYIFSPLSLLQIYTNSPHTHTRDAIWFVSLHNLILQLLIVDSAAASFEQIDWETKMQVKT